MRGFNLSEWALQNRSLVAYFMAIVIAAGTLSYFRLGRSEDPSFTIKIMVIQALWPGATISDTMNLVTDRIERKLQGAPGLDYTRSYTTAGQSVIFVHVKDSTPQSEVADVWYQVRKKVGDVRSSLPRGVIGPEFNDEFGDTFGIVYGFTADGFSHRELKDYVEDARSRLLQVRDVSKIDVIGAQDERIYLEFSTDKMSGLGLDWTAVLAALEAQNAVTPAGTVSTEEDNLVIRVSGSFKSIDDLLAVSFIAKDRLIRLADIAKVRRSYSDPPQPMFRVNGQPAIGLAISMLQGGDILALGRNIEREMAAVTADLPVGIEPHLVADQALTVTHAVDEFTEALWEALGIVLVVSFVSLGMRAGAVVALSIPLVLAFVFVAMSISGIDMQRVSLGALIIALGLLVDDAMITVETMITRLEQGDSKAQAATFAYTSTAFPMLAGTLVTVAGFVPIGFARSAAGEYTFSLFAVVAIALLASWIVAVLFSPLLGVMILKTPKHGHAAKQGWVLVSFRYALTFAMRRRWVTLAITLLVLASALFSARFVHQQFFPPSDRPELIVDLKLPQPASIYSSEKLATQIDDVLRRDEDVEHWSTNIGQGAVRFYLPLNVQLPNSSFVEIVIVSKGLEQRERLKQRLETLLADQFPNVVARVAPLELGPPIGWPLQWRVSGPDVTKIREIAFQVAEVMDAHPSVQKVNYNWIEPMRAIRIDVDQNQARHVGLSSENLSQSLNTVVSGATVTQVRDGIYLIDVIARAGDDERVSLSTIRSLQVPIPGGRTVPLSQIATIRYSQEYPIVWRRNRIPTITVQGENTPGTLPATIVQDLAPRIENLDKALPEGFRIELGGTEEESRKSQGSVIEIVPIMLLLTCTILMLQLRKLSGLFLVLSVTPLGIIGVVFALLLAGKPLGFVAILGVLALIGMIARNSVILVDQIEHEMARGLDPWNAVLEATTHRFRPILLTAAAAILGMIPIAPTVFWGPMAYAIMGGLATATLLTLLFLPALYLIWFRIPEPRLAAMGAGHAPTPPMPAASPISVAVPEPMHANPRPAEAGLSARAEAFGANDAPAADLDRTMVQVQARPQPVQQPEPPAAPAIALPDGHVDPASVPAAHPGGLREAEAPISQGDIQAAIGALLPLIGPVAKILVSREARSMPSRDDFYLRLSEAISDPADRKAFLASQSSRTGRAAQ